MSAGGKAGVRFAGARALKSDTPVVDFDVLIQLTEALVHHRRGENASKLGKGPADFGHDGL